MVYMVYGEYNRYGYRIFQTDNSTNMEIEIHIAGNHRLDSYQTVSPNSPDCLSLQKIRNCCIKTGKEIAEERKAKWIGAERS